MNNKPTRPTTYHVSGTTLCYARSDVDAYIDAIEQERDQWARLYSLCNAREQRLLAIKEAAQRFICNFDDDCAWIENSGAADHLLDVLRARIEGDDND